MKRTYSAFVGIVGGLLDLVAGISLLWPAGMMHTVGSEFAMVSPIALWMGYFLEVFGIVVLLTGLYLLIRRMVGSSFVGLLMFLYGVIMLGIGISMLGRFFSMMQNSAISGVAMLLVGVAMLYSGYGMKRKMGS